MKHSIDCVGFKPLRKGTLVGFAEIVIRELKLTIYDVGLHEKGKPRWASPRAAHGSGTARLSSAATALTARTGANWSAISSRASICIARSPWWPPR